MNDASVDKRIAEGAASELVVHRMFEDLAKRVAEGHPSVGVRQ